MFYEHHETIGRDYYIKSTLVGRNTGTAIAPVLATIDGGVAIEYFLPSGIRDGQQVLLDDVTVDKGSVI